jgi:hypothetical protein
VAELPRYRLDFLVPEIHDIAEEHAGVEAPFMLLPRNPTLDRLRAALAEDPRWTRSMLAPWRPFGQYQQTRWYSGGLGRFTSRDGILGELVQPIVMAAR